MSFRIINLSLLKSRPVDCPPCEIIPKSNQSWLSLSTGIKATYWLAFFAVSAICILFPNETENEIIDDQWMNLRGRIQTDDLFRLFDPNAYSQR